MTNEPRDAYARILNAIDRGTYGPNTPLVESELAKKFEISRTPIREALQRLETQGILRRDGRSLIVSSLSHEEMGELYVVRIELEGLAARLAAQHAAPEEIGVLKDMVRRDRSLVTKPLEMSRANRRLHETIHRASRNRYLVQQLNEVHRAMALLVKTTLAEEGRAQQAQGEHEAIVEAIAARDGDQACAQIRAHISAAYKTRLQLDIEDSP